ncbi:MAG: 3-deoxy-D-manno-octulosonic acid transferase [Cellvibrionaceae bacterium]
MIRIVYTIILYLSIPLILLRLLFRARKAPAYAKRWSERFGFFKSPESSGISIEEVAPSQQKTIWLHSVSVGETIAAAPLVHRLLNNDAKNEDEVNVTNNNDDKVKAISHKKSVTCIVITTTTPTGSEQVNKLFKNEIASGKIFHVYAPYDLPDCIARFLKKIKPDLFVIMETELWPNIISQCHKKNIPIILANGRLSEKSANGYHKIKWLIEDTFSQLSVAAAQHRDDADRMLSLGLREESCEVTGNIKFDLAINDEVQKSAENFKTSLHQTKQRIVLIAASTHDGEDDIIIEAYKAAKNNIENLLLLLVPRHPERFSYVVSLCQESGLHTQQRSHHEILLDNTDVLVGDTMGELLMLLGASDIAFIGGSLVPVGGHNLMEPAAWGLPIITGPHLYNFSEASQLLLADKAMHIVNNSKQLEDLVVSLSTSEITRKAMGARARDVALANRGALDKLVLLIKKTL